MYVPQRTWLTQGPAARSLGLGDMVTVGFPQMDDSSRVDVQFPFLTPGPGGGSANPFGFIEGSQPLNIVQSVGPGSAAIGGPCFQVGFPWFGSKTAAGTCKPVFDLGPVVGVMVTALLVGTFFLKGVRR